MLPKCPATIICTSSAGALVEYKKIHGAFPLEGTQEVGCTRVHSWRVYILPELGYDELYNQYNFNESWDSEANRRVMAQMPEVFGCPNCQTSTYASYFAVRSSDFARQSTIGRSYVLGVNVDRESSGSEDGDSVLVIEVNGQRLHWTDPRGLPIDVLMDLGLKSCDPNGRGFVDSAGAVGRPIGKIAQ